MSNFGEMLQEKLDELYKETGVQRKLVFGDDLSEEERMKVKQIQSRAYAIKYLQMLRQEITGEIKMLKQQQESIALSMPDGLRGMLGINVKVVTGRMVEIREERDRITSDALKSNAEYEVCNMVDDVMGCMESRYKIKPMEEIQGGKDDKGQE